MKNKKAFTLIELIVVVAIVGVLVAMLAPMASGQIDNAKKTAAKANARTFYSASQSAVATMAAGWETKGAIIPFGMLDITDIYYETGLYRVYFGKDIANKGGLVEPVGTPIDTTKGWISADETNTNTSTSPYLNDIKEINKHMALYIGKDNKLVLDKGGYKFVGTGGGTTTPPPTPIVKDDANPANVTLNITTTGINATGTFAGREYRLAVSGLTPQAKYQVTIDGTSVGEFTYTDTMDPINLEGKFTATTHDVVATHKQEVNVVAVDPLLNFPAAKTPIEYDLTFYDGDGSATNPYLICDPESLQMLSHKVNADNANFGGKNYKQIVTIDMKPVANFTPIGSNSNAFKGTYDGGAKLDATGHEIRNLKINLPGESHVGLFGAVVGGTLKNIGIGEGSSILGQGLVGGIVGELASKSTVTNVYNKANVSGDQNGIYVAGIAGSAGNSTITNAYNVGNIGGASGQVAGIVARLSGGSSIANVYNTGSVSMGHPGWYTGGIVAILISSSINNAYNTGAITSLGDYAAGIVSEFSGAGVDISNVYNTGNISGKLKTGAVIGGGLFRNLQGTNRKFKKGTTVTGTLSADSQLYNIEYNKISEFFYATGIDSGKWNDKGQLLNADGTVMGGPNPGGQ